MSEPAETPTTGARGRLRRTFGTAGAHLGYGPGTDAEGEAEHPPFDIRKHLPSAAAILLMVEIYGVSDYSVTSSLAIASSASIGQVVMGAALALLPYLLPIACLLALGRTLQLYAAGAHADTVIVAAAVFVATLLLSAWQNILVVVVAGTAYVLLFAGLSRVMSHRGRTAEGDPSVRLRAFPLALIALLVAFFATIDDPWVAPELITVTASPAVAAALDGEDGFVRSGDTYRGVAYPLDSSGGSFSVLARTTRRVVRLPGSAVLSRSICRYDLPSHKEVLLHELLGHSDVPPNPYCPTVEQLGG